MKLFGQAFLLMSVLSTQAWAQGIPLVPPLAGTNNVDWTIVNYVDLDSTGGTRDYTGAVGSAAFTYNGHTGIDFTLPNFAASERGVPVYAAAGGTVSLVRDVKYDRCSNDCNLSGVEEANYIYITNPNGYETLYYHLARNSALVNVGDTVVAGQQIALIGSSGNSSDAHLHFEVHKNGAVIETYQNPTQFWSNPLPYAANGVRAIDSGFTRQGPTTAQLRDRPSDNDVVYQSDGSGQQISFWAQLHSVAAGDLVRYRLFDPNGTQSADFPLTYTGNWGWTNGFFNLPNTPLAGVWTAAVLVNGNTIRSDQFTVVAGAQTRSWSASNAFAVLWSTPENWAGNIVPAAGNDVRITHTDGIARSVILDQASPTIRTLFLDLTGIGTTRANFYNSGRDMAIMDSLIVGENGRATFNQVGGRITTANPNLDVGIGYQTGSDGIYNMSSNGSSNASLHVSRGLYIGSGSFAKGTFNQASGTTIATSVVVGHQFGAVGTYNLSGGTLKADDLLYVGNIGQGDLNVTGRSQVITRNGATIGYSAGSRGIVTFDGARTFWDTVPGGSGRLVVGREGTGTLNIRNGATVNSVSASLGESSVGNRTGNVNVGLSTGNGGGNWNISGLLVVGESGVGNLTVTNAGAIRAGSVTIGSDVGSLGTVVLNNSGGITSTGDVYIGYGGTGRVTVSHGGLEAANLNIGIFNGVGRLTLVDGGAAIINGTTTVGPNGTLDGDYVIGGTGGLLRNFGVVNPATSPTDPGTLFVNGDYRQEAQGTLKMSLASTNDYSVLYTVASGSPGHNMFLNGTLNVTTSGGFAPGAGQSFDLLNTTIISGTFQTLQLPTLPSGLTWDISKLYTTGVISVSNSSLAGDFNTDGYVDARDYLVFRKRNGTQAEYSAWRANFGRDLGGAGAGSSSAAIPEPATATLFVGALVVAMVRRASRSSH